MDILGVTDLPGWLVGIIVFVMTICFYTWYKQSTFKRMGIPQKPTIFFFGEMFELSKKGFGYIDYEMVKQNGNVFGVYLGNTPTLIISDTDMIKQIMVKEFSKFTDRPDIITVTKAWESSIIFATGEHWRFLRSTMTPMFSTGKLREMNAFMHNCMKTLHELLDKKIAMHPEGFDIQPHIRAYTMDVICSTGFGLDVGAQKNTDTAFIKYARTFVEFGGLTNPLYVLQIFFPDIQKIFGKFLRVNVISNDAYDFYKKTLEEAFKGRKQDQSNHKDMLQLLLKAHRDKGDFNATDDDLTGAALKGMQKRGLTDEEVLINSIMFMIAGHDTTATTLQWIIYDIVTNPECQEKLIEEIDDELRDVSTTYDNVFKLKYLDMVVSETLRIHPPVPRLVREALEEVTINGVQIKKGMDCTFPVRALHFMPEYWENPNKYDPERFESGNQANINQCAYMPFGQGPRHCIGKRLALFEVKATIVTLLQKYRFYKTDKLKVPMPTLATFGIVKPAAPVFVRLEKRAKDASVMKSFMM